MPKLPLKLYAGRMIIRRVLLDFLDPAVVFFVLFSIRPLFNLERA
jgi:hypothetical protein